MVCFDGNLAVPWNRKLSELHFEFHGRENNSKLRSVEHKYKQTLNILFLGISQKIKQLNFVPWNKI
jgi:hypothetical protein